jgi:cation/acetate symporter
LTFEDKNGDGKIQYYNDNSRTAFLAAKRPKKQRQQLTIDKDIMVLANPEITNWVIALVAARL